MISTIWALIITTAAGLLGAALAAFAKRKQSSAETKKTIAEASSIEIANVNTLIELWKTLVEDLRSEVKSLSTQVLSLKEEIVRLEGVIKANTAEHKNGK